MVDVAMLTKQGGRDHNEDYIRKATYEEQLCLILCDGLGGHACGEIASELVAESIAKRFEKQATMPDFSRMHWNRHKKNYWKNRCGGICATP